MLLVNFFSGERARERKRFGALPHDQRKTAPKSCVFGWLFSVKFWKIKSWSVVFYILFLRSFVHDRTCFDLASN